MILFDRTHQRFLRLFITQVISTIATNMVEIALGIWAWQQTGQATPLAIVVFISFLPSIFLGSIGGVMVDRWPRKLMLCLTDLAAGLSSLFALYLVTTGNLRIEYIYAIAAWDAIFRSLGGNAFSVTIPDLVVADKLTQANGLKAGVNNASSIAAPALVGVLYGLIGLVGFLIIDVVTFLIAIFNVIITKLPEISKQAQEQFVGFWEDYRDSFRYFANSPNLRNFIFLVVILDIVGAMGQAIISPMILASHGETTIYGYALTALGAGAVIGTIAMGTRDGPKNLVGGMLLANALISFFGYVALGFSQNLFFLFLGAFSITLFIPLLFATQSTYLQTAVDRSILGSIFGLRGSLGALGGAMVVLLYGFLADRVFEPLMRDGSAPQALAALVGTGPGAGMRLMFLISGCLGVLVSLVAFLVGSSFRVKVEEANVKT
jgi:MFS transporter, DHA3 family, macrolide efflux protein